MENDKIRQKFTEIYERETDALFRYASFRVGSREEAKDMVENVFVSFWQKCRKGAKIKNPRAFLFTSLRNRIIDWYRKKKTESLESDETFEPADPDAFRFIIASAEAREILKALEKLSPEYRDPVYMRLVENFSPEEIAETLQISANAASVRINRGIEKIKKDMGIEK